MDLSLPSTKNALPLGSRCVRLNENSLNSDISIVNWLGKEKRE